MGKVICNYAERLLVSDQIQLSATLIWGYFPKWNWGVSIIKLCSTPTKIIWRNWAKIYTTDHMYICFYSHKFLIFHLARRTYLFTNHTWIVYKCTGFSSYVKKFTLQNPLWPPATWLGETGCQDGFLIHES